VVDEFGILIPSKFGFYQDPFGKPANHLEYPEMTVIPIHERFVLPVLGVEIKVGEEVEVKVFFDVE